MLKGRFRLYDKWYVRDEIANIPDDIFIFGDNVDRKGSGPKSGQAIIRGLPNAWGIATKWHPTMYDDAFFSDDQECWKHVFLDFERVFTFLNSGTNVWYPAAGIGEGRAKLPEKAPKLYEAINILVGSMLERYK